MSAQPAPTNLHTEPGQHAANAHAADTHATDAQYYRHALHDLIDLGSDLARLLHQQASAQAAQQAITQAHAAPQHPGPQPAPAPAPDALVPDTLTSIAAAFDRIARAVRRSIALARSLADPIQPARDPARHRAAARKRILREVEDAIQRTAPASGHGASGHAALDGSGADAADADDDSAEALTAELHDRLDAPDLDEDISHRPVADIITEICRDLGLAALPGAHPWMRRTPADLEHLCARAAAPSRARQPGTGPPMPATPQRTPTSPVPPGPAAIPRAPGPTHTGSGPPDDPAGIATIQRHPIPLGGQWRPPPEPQQTSEAPHQ
jgi:hypothetical protein